LNLTINAFQCVPEKHSVEIKGWHSAQPLKMEEFKDGPGERLVNREAFKNEAPLVALSVSDNGPGISDDVLPKIFDQYFTTKAASQGTGLGLNIVHRLVKEARGALHVRTKLGRGTTFTVYLPACE
jgi:signal transduction histidine kinase